MTGALDMAVRFRLSDVLAEKQMTQSELARRSAVSFVTIDAIARSARDRCTSTRSIACARR